MTERRKKILVIGGGVSGITCALLLQKSGFVTEVISKDDFERVDPSPSLGSLYPAASIIPHSVKHPNLNSLFERSQKVFKHLNLAAFQGLKTHLHFELFSEKQRKPEYHHLLKKFKVLKSHELSKAPSHPEIPIQFGYQFECFFADWNIYFPALVKAYLESGGIITKKELKRDQIVSLDSDIIINCAQLGGPELAGEEFEPVIYMGHLVKINGVPPLKKDPNETVSYNFTPGKKYYQSEKGHLLDVYCYSRESDLVLGGSRLTGTISENGDWVGEKVIEPSIKIGKWVIPEQIFSLNSEIIKNYFGSDISSYKERSVHIGYRFMGNKEIGLNLSSEQLGGKLLIHNFGHGGAGVTLSWGCAIEIQKMISQHYGVKNSELPELLNSLSF